MDGALVLNSKGSPKVVRHRTYYQTRAEADADRPRLETQHAAAGAVRAENTAAASRSDGNKMILHDEPKTFSPLSGHDLR